MRKRKTALAAAICTFVLICIFAVAFFFSSMSYQTDRYKVTLPNELENTDDLNNTNVMDDQRDQFPEIPELTVDNVQAVIESLSRPEEYIGFVTNTLYLQEDESAVWHATTYFKNAAQRVEWSRAGESHPEIQLYYQDTVYAWEQGNASYWSSNAGVFTADMTAMIPSYRDICQMPAQMIEETEIMFYEGRPSARIVCSDDTEYVVSLISGLLEHVKYYENGELVREVVISSSEEEIADAMFILPGKTEPVYAAK